MAARRAAPKRTGAINRNVVWIAVSVMLLAGCFLGGLVNGDNEDVVPPPTAVEIADTVELLSRAAEAQGVCYGWLLEELGRPVSVGSNLGDGTPVQDEARCPRWVEVVARVHWTPENSELDDTATIDVRGSDNFPRLELLWIRDTLSRFGLDERTFIDEPGWATTRAAVVLPLLMAEEKLVDPVPTSSAPPAVGIPPLPEAGSDMWRDRWGLLLAVAVLLLIAAAQLTVGFVQRARQRRWAALRPGDHPRRARP